MIAAYSSSVPVTYVVEFTVISPCIERLRTGLRAVVADNAFFKTIAGQCGVSTQFGERACRRQLEKPGRFLAEQ